jgi:hypothetical protein
MFISLPMGLWALLILVKRPVRDGFNLVLQGWGRRLSDGPPGRPNGLSRDVVPRRLAGPVVALMVAGSLQCLCQFLLAMPVLMFLLYEEYALLIGGDLFRDWRHGSVRSDTALLLAPAIAVFAAWFFLGLHVGISMIRTALQLRRLRSYRLAVRGAVLALLPCTLTSLLALPVGIWTLFVLSDRDVEEAFASDRPPPPLPLPPPAVQRTGPFRRKARSFLDSVLAVFVTRPGKSARVTEEPPDIPAGR